MIEIMQDMLSPGSQFGCLTVVYYPYYAKGTDKSDYLCKCQCECGSIHYLYPQKFVSHNPNLLIKSCPLKESKRTASLPRKHDDKYFNDYTGTTWETLDIVECIDDHWEDWPHIISKQRCVGSEVPIHKLYKCRCRLCHKELYFKSSDFKIDNPSHGPHAEKGYFSNAYCACHETSSFQWTTMKILLDHNIPHIAEYSFDDLLGTNRGMLRFDFAIFDTLDKHHIIALIECQGPHHCKDIYGKAPFQKQFEHDNAKATYASKHDIPLIQIPYSRRGYEKIKDYLAKYAIL